MIKDKLTMFLEAMVKNETNTVVTPDGQVHQTSDIVPQKGLDVAIIRVQESKRIST